MSSALASHTPDPTSVTVAGSLQDEAGCPGEWDPACAATHLAYDDNDDVWQGTFRLPAGDYEYKAPSTTPGTRTTGSTPRKNGANIPLDLPAHERQVLLRPQEPLGHRRPAARRSPCRRLLPVRAGLLRRLGSGLPPVLAAGPRRRRHLHLRDNRPAAPTRTRRKVAINESWDENYGAGGVLNGSDIAFTVPSDHEGHLQLRRSDARPHDRRRRRPRRARRPGALSHFDLARKDCLGTARNTTSKVWYTVAGGVLSDVYYPTVDNTNVETLQYIVTRRLDVHRPPGPRHDVHGARPWTTGRDGLPGDRHRPRAASTGS